MVRVDEDGCCEMCGAMATGTGADEALRYKQRHELNMKVERLEIQDLKMKLAEARSVAEQFRDNCEMLMVVVRDPLPWDSK